MSRVIILAGQDETPAHELSALLFRRILNGFNLDQKIGVLSWALENPVAATENPSTEHPSGRTHLIGDDYEVGCIVLILDDSNLDTVVVDAVATWRIHYPHQRMILVCSTTTNLANRPTQWDDSIVLCTADTIEDALRSILCPVQT